MYIRCTQAPYHHKREIGSLREFTTKKKLYEHLVVAAPEVKEITLPINEKRKRGVHEITVPVTPDFHLKSASTKIPDIDEMRDGFLRVLREKPRARLHRGMHRQASSVLSRSPTSRQG